MMKMRILLAVCLLAAAPLARAEDGTGPTSRQPRSLDPMNRPMDELGVTGKDDTLCSDRWYSCTTYDRQQFDRKYPGRPLNELLRFGEPNWPDRPPSGHGGSKSDRMDDGDRLDRRLDRD